MWIIEKLKVRLNMHALPTRWQMEELERVYYDIRWEFTDLYRKKRNLWEREWWRLVRENKPRPHSYDAFRLIKMNEMARKITDWDCPMRLSVEGGDDLDHVWIKATSKKWPDFMVTRSYYEL